MEKSYVLVIKYPGSDQQVIMHNTEAEGKKAFIAREGNQYLLLEVGARLLEEGLIDGYQLFVSDGYPVLKP